MTWTRTTRRSIRISLTTAILTCIRASIVLLRIIGQGRWQHPFHEHANHVRILARDGNLILSPDRCDRLAGPLLFTTTTTPGLAMDGIFYYTGRGLNWDMYGHNAGPDCQTDAERHAALHSRCERIQHGRRRRQSTTTSGARTTTSRCRSRRSGTWPPAVR